MPSSRQNLLLFFLSLFTPALSHPLAFHCICMGGAASKPLGFVQYLVTFLVHGCWWYVCACSFAEYSVTPPLTHSICKMFLFSMVGQRCWGSWTKLLYITGSISCPHSTAPVLDFSGSLSFVGESALITLKKM